MRRSVGVLSGAGAGVLLAALWLAVPEDRIATLAAGEMQRLTGRDIEVGDVGARLWPAPGIVLSDVVVDGPGGALAVADRVVVTVGAGALFGGEVAITGVEVSGLHAVAGRDSNGRSLWTLARGREGGAAGSALALRQVVVRDGSFDWADAQAGRSVLVTAIEARVVRGAVEASAVVNGQPVTLQAEAEDVAALWSGGSVARAELQAGDVQVLFDGRAGAAPLFAEGALTADLADLAAVAALAGADVPDLPAGLGRDLRQVQGRLTLTPQGSWHLREATVALDGNRLSIAADLSLDGARPRLTAQVDGAELDIVVDGARPVLPLAAWLGLADAELGLRLGHLTVDGRPMGPVRAEARVDRARAVVTAREVGLFGGRVAGEVVVNARDAGRGGGLSVAGDLTAAGVDLAAAAAAMGWGDRLTGLADARLSFRGAGDTPSAILADLQGQGRAGIGRAVWQGTDLAALFRSAGSDGAGGSTQIDLATATLALQGGELRTDDLRVETAGLALAGTATVGLAARTLDLRVTPARLKASDGTDAAPVPLRLTGTWDALQPAFDLSVLVERELAADRQRAAEPLPGPAAEPVQVVPLSGMR